MQKYELRIKFLILLIISLGFYIGLVDSRHVFAQQVQKGVSVTPSIAHIDLSVDPSEHSLTYVNNYDTDIVLKLSAKDFTELEESYKLEFLSDKQSENYKYSLSSWLSFENQTLELAPKEKKSVKIFIDNNRITKGGHYASILAEIVQPDAKKDISIKAILSSLLFVRASTGKEIEEGKISLFAPSRDGLEFPSKFLLRFQNNGNVHVIPYGIVQIYDPFGRMIGKGILNEDSLDALPESIRTYSVPVTSSQAILIPGKYTAKLSLHFGKTNQKLEFSTRFFSQGSFDFIKIGIGVVLITVILFIYRKRIKTKKLP